MYYLYLCLVQVQNVCQSSWNNLRKFIFSFDHMTSSFNVPQFIAKLVIPPNYRLHRRWQFNEGALYYIFWNEKNQSLFKGMQVHVYLNLTLLLNKGIASRQVNEMKTTHVHVFSWIIPLTYFWKSFDCTLWICLVINSLWITFHVCLWLFQFAGWGYVNMNSVIFHLHMIDVYLCFCLWIFLQV